MLGSHSVAESPLPYLASLPTRLLRCIPVSESPLLRGPVVFLFIVLEVVIVLEVFIVLGVLMVSEVVIVLEVVIVQLFGVFARLSGSMHN